MIKPRDNSHHQDLCYRRQMSRVSRDDLSMLTTLHWQALSINIEFTLTDRDRTKTKTVVFKTETNTKT